MSIPQRVTLARVAQRARVSKMTVSRVVNNRPGVSPHLRARVQRVIDQLGYVPSLRARSLALGRSNMVGVLVPDILSEWITPLLLGVGEAAAALGFQLLLRTTGRGQAYTPESPDLFIGSGLADGVLVASWRVPAEFARRMAQQGGAIVLIDGFVRPSDVPWVSTADSDGARAMVRHLAGLGHRRIGFVGGGEGPYLARQRLAGYQAGLADAGLAPDEALVTQGDFTRESGYQCARSLLQLPDPPTAIFAANDPMAVGVLQAAHDLRRRLPEQLSVAGFDDTLAAGAYPALTTVARDYQEMGRRALHLLADYVNGRVPAGEVVQIDVPTRLVVRQSTARPHRRVA